MEKEYEFPVNNWYIKMTEDNKELLNEWKIQQKYNKPINLSESIIIYINWDGHSNRLTTGWSQVNWGKILITTEEFKKYVLNISEEPTEDYNYLNDLFIKFNIK
jgi:hypothetical protein